MNTIARKRILTVLLICVLAVAFWLTSAGNVHAAAKKTFNVVTKAVTEYETTDEDDPGKATVTFNYNSDGLIKSATDTMNMYGFSGINSDWETVFKYDKNGLTKSAVAKYKGEDANKTVYTIKKGKITASKYYDTQSGKQLISKDKYTYNKKNGKLTKVETKYMEDGSKTTITYHSNGKPKKYTSNFITKQTIKFDKHGYPTSSKIYYDDGDSNIITLINTYDKKGRIKKIESYEDIVYDGRSYTETETTTFNYTTESGKITRVVQTTHTVSDWGGHDIDETQVITTRYWHKKIKVAKKYWNIVKKQQESIF